MNRISHLGPTSHYSHVLVFTTLSENLTSDLKGHCLGFKFVQNLSYTFGINLNLLRRLVLELSYSQTWISKLPARLTAFYVRGIKSVST